MSRDTDSIAIRAEGLAKRYRLGRREGYRTLWDAVNRATTRRRREEERTIWALDDVSFDVRQGEILGLIGSNGAGKTTLLKVLSRITQPTRGRAELRGRVGSLLEVGTGFHPELTGRENVFLNGAILGMRTNEIRSKFDDIVGFAEVERFIDTPVKYYSSGMYVRLAFAVAAFLEPEILLVDEVLSVGDAAFQRRCLGKMDEVASSGRTIVFVSHNMSVVARLCTHSLLLERGRIERSGPPRAVIEEYLTKGANSGERHWSPDAVPEGPFRPVSLSLRQLGESTDSISAEEPFAVDFEYELAEEVRNLLIQMTLRTPDGIDLLTTQDRDDPFLDEQLLVRRPGRYRASFSIPGHLLNEGRFVVAVNVTTRPKVRHYFNDQNACMFSVYRIGGAGSQIDAPVGALLRPRLEWSVEQTDYAWSPSDTP